MSNNHIERNAWLLLSIMVEQNIREISNAELQSLSGIEDGQEVNDSLEWLEETGAVQITWIQATANPLSGADVKLKARGRSMYQSHLLEQDKNMSSESVSNTGLDPSSLDLFISHSSQDTDLALAFIELIKNACRISPERIRCTSVSGHKLPSGVPIDQQLQVELRKAKLFLGLITPSSIQSTYVLFELGARWGANLQLSPVLARGKQNDAEMLKGPLSGLNALKADASSDMHQLVDEFKKSLGSPDVSASIYQRYIDEVVRLAVAPNP